MVMEPATFADALGTEANSSPQSLADRIAEKAHVGPSGSISLAALVSKTARFPENVSNTEIIYIYIDIHIWVARLFKVGLDPANNAVKTAKIVG